jgi:hypothetical protein
METVVRTPFRRRTLLVVATLPAAALAVSAGAQTAPRPARAAEHTTERTVECLADLRVS